MQDSAIVRWEAGVAGGAGEPMGSARLELVSGVALLREEDAVLEAMLAGWAKQQLGGRGPSSGAGRQRQGRGRQVPGRAGPGPREWTARPRGGRPADLVAVGGG